MKPTRNRRGHSAGQAVAGKPRTIDELSGLLCQMPTFQRFHGFAFGSVKDAGLSALLSVIVPFEVHG